MIGEIKKTVKKIIKEILLLRYGLDIEEIKNEIDQHTVISFDIFDTLVERNTPVPEDVFVTIEKESGFPLYFRKRIYAEKRARHFSMYEEVELKDIYSCFEGLSDTERHYLQDLECAQEIKVCHTKISGMVLYKYAKERDKTIIITSDMYLPESTIKDILQKCSYIGYKKLFLSSTYKKKKKTGGLFEIVKSEFGNDILHIGDNSYCDGFAAERVGVKGVILPKQMTGS